MYCLSVKNSEENSRLFQAFKGAFIFQGIGDGNPVPPSRRLSDTTIAFSNFCSFSRSVFPFTSRSDFLSHSHLLLCLFVHFSLLFYRLIHFTPFASFGGGRFGLTPKDRTVLATHLRRRVASTFETMLSLMTRPHFFGTHPETRDQRSTSSWPKPRSKKRTGMLKMFVFFFIPKATCVGLQEGGCVCETKLVCSLYFSSGVNKLGFKTSCYAPTLFYKVLQEQTNFS